MIPTSALPTSTGQSPTGDDAGVVQQAQDKIGQVADQAQNTAAQMTEQVKQQATSQLESQKTRAVDSLVSVAQALRQTGQHLHEQQQNGMAGYVDQAAERVERLTNHVRMRDVPQLLDDTEDLARSKPAVFFGAALTLGFVGARFLMSSGRRARTQRSYGPGGQNAGPGYAGHGSAYGQPNFSYGQPAARGNPLSMPPAAMHTPPSPGGIDAAPSGTPVA